HGAEPVRAAAVRLAAGWRLAPAGPRVLELAADRATPPDLRLAAVEALGDLPGSEVVVQLKRLAADAGEPFPVRRQAALSLLAAAPSDALPPLRDLLAATTAEPDAGSLWRAVLGSGTVSVRLAAALRDQPLPAA